MKGNLIIFIKRLLLLLLLFIVLDQAIGRLLNYLYFKHEPATRTTTTYVADYCNQQILIFGSSRACYQYISNNISAKTKLSCFNAGVPGDYILYSYAMLKCVLKRYTPKVIILDIMPDEFKLLQSNYDRLSVLLPYYQQHPEVRGIVNLRSRFENLKLLSKTYPFNSQVLDIISRNLHTNKNEFAADTQNGFIPLTDTIDAKGNVFVNNTYDDYVVDATLVNAYKLFINQCIQHHIQLYIFVSPELSTNRYKRKSIKLASKIAAINHIPFFDYTDTLSIKNKSYFKDIGHLNINGAKIYTSMVINDIAKNN